MKVAEDEEKQNMKRTRRRRGQEEEQKQKVEWTRDEEDLKINRTFR
jgi:hypothetical protein